MKNTLLTITLLIAFFNQGFAQMDAVPFNNLLIEQKREVSIKNLEYISYSVHSDDYEAIEKKRLEVILQVVTAHKVISAVQAPDAGQQMKDEALEILDIYKDVFTYDFLEVAKLKENRQSSYEAMEDYFEAQDKAEEKIAKTAERFAKAQEKFAQKVGMELRANEETKDQGNDIDIINEVYDYTRNVFLPYFKASKANAIFMDAMNEEKSAAALENKRKKVEAAAAESIKILRADRGFKGSKTYRDSAIDLVKYIQELAKKDYVDMIALTKMQAKKQSQLTNDDIKKYNDLVEKYNASIATYNKKMNDLTDRFNEADNKLLQKYIPNIGVVSKKTKRL